MPQGVYTRQEKICKVDGCGKKHWGAGYCSMHYSRVRTYGTTELPEGLRSRNHPDKCSIDGCDRKYDALGYCAYHYIKARRQGIIGAKKCSIKGCEKKSYAKGYCFRHYSQVRKNGEKLYVNHKCSAPNCDKQIRHGKYCPHHKRRIKAGMPFDATHSEMFSGPRNPRWKGGKADYYRHSEFKRQRKIRLLATNYTCESCGDVASVVHHKDGSKINHNQDNLQALCRFCHWKIHSGRKNSSKYVKKYGLNLKELSTQLNVSVTTVFLWHRKGVLQNNIDNINNTSSTVSGIPA